MTNEERRQELKAEKSRQKKGNLKGKAIKYAFGCQIIKLEKACFGWHYVGHTVDDDVTYSVSDSGRINKHHHIIKYAYFQRPAVWKKNFLFSLTETLANIVSFFRRIFIGASVLIAIVVGIMFGTGNVAYGGLILGIFGGVIVLSLLLAGLGYLWKKVFKLEEKTDEILTANGYDVWAANEEGEKI